MIRKVWQVVLQGGAYDGWEAETDLTPEMVLIVWRCDTRCGGHATFNPGNPGIVLRTAESYRRVEIDPDGMRAVYQVGESDPDVVEERELAVAGSAGLGDGWPVAL